MSSIRNQTPKGISPAQSGTGQREVTEALPAPRPRDPFDERVSDSVIESIDSKELSAFESSLAQGTHDSDPHAAGERGSPASDFGEDNTKVATPLARVKPPSINSKPASAKIAPRAKNDTEGDSHVGQTLGSYRILQLLGKGGMGYVYRAEHIKLGREVALKLLRSDYSKRRDAVARFFQEARTVNRVRHRNIVDVTDFVELDDGTTFIIMEFLRGQSLGKWSRNKVDLPRALAILVQICDGLEAAHALGVIHRDLKPDNIFVEPQPDNTEVVKILDFGVAKLLNRDDEDVGFQTAAGSVIGTPAYMSPEQAGGMNIDGRSDIYSLGAIMYELFTGQTMFKGRSFGEYVRKHLTEAPIAPHLTKGGASIDPRVEQAILGAIEKDPNRRFADAAALRDTLLGILGGIETQPPMHFSGPMFSQSPLGVASLPNPVNVSTVQPPTSATVSRAPQAQLTAHVSPTDIARKITEPENPAVTHVPPQGGHSELHAAGTHGLGSYPSSQHPPVVQPALGWPPTAEPVHLPRPAPAARKTWPWILALVASLGGVGVAIVVASSGGSNGTEATVSKPGISESAVKPIVEPKQRTIEVRFESSPPGGVFAEGSSTEQCRTPCSLRITMDEMSSEQTRTYMIRAEGRKDTPVTVDLSPKGRREYAVSLPAKSTASIRPLPSEDGSEAGSASGSNGSASGSNGSAASNEVQQPDVSTEKPDRIRPNRKDKPDKVERPEPVKPEPNTNPVNSNSTDVTKTPPTTDKKATPPVKIKPSDTIDPFKNN